MAKENDILGRVPQKQKPTHNLALPEGKSIIIDPTNILNYVGTRSKPGAVGYSVLRSMAVRAKPVAAIIQTRLNQTAMFTRRPGYPGDTGFRIGLKDVDRQPTEAERKKAKEIEEALLTTGFLPNMRRKDNFDSFLRKLVRDSLTLDALAFELVYNRKGEVCEWWAVDGGTIEIVTDMANPQKSITTYQPVTRGGQAIDGEIAYVQRYHGQTYAEFTEDELAYAIRNPRTDLAYSLFGLSELEILVETVTGILNAENYNSAYFSHSNLPQGVLEIVGQYEDEHLEGFKRHWESLVSGAVGKWKVPVMAMQEGQGLKFTPFKQSSKDMEFHQWLEFLTNIACAVYQIDPAEIGLKSWGGGSSMVRSEAEASRLDHSKSKGFFPLMQFLANTINSELINRIDPAFEFEWVGLNEEDSAHLEKQRMDRLTTGFSTINEERKHMDMPTVEEALIDAGYDKETAKALGRYGDAPSNAQLLQVFMQGLQSTQQPPPEQPQQPPTDQETEKKPPRLGAEGTEESDNNSDEVTKSITVEIEW